MEKVIFLKSDEEIDAVIVTALDAIEIDVQVFNIIQEWLYDVDDETAGTVSQFDYTIKRLKEIYGETIKIYEAFGSTNIYY